MLIKYLILALRWKKCWSEGKSKLGFKTGFVLLSIGSLAFFGTLIEISLRQGSVAFVEIVSVGGPPLPSSPLTQIHSSFVSLQEKAGLLV